MNESEDGHAIHGLEFRLLGPMEVLVDGRPSKLPGTAERALLVQLLLAPGRTIPATILVDRLWSESKLPVDPMNALQLRVSKLRRALTEIGVEDLVTRAGVGYRADVLPTQVDALNFADRLRAAQAETAHVPNGNFHDRHLRAFDDALSLWRGDPLSDFATEQWASAEAARLTELKLAALTERSRIALALGRHLEVIGELEPLVAQDPTLESLTGLLMVALYRSGRQADALQVYARTRDLLDEALGLECSLSLRSLHERLLRQDPSLGEQSELSAPALVASGRRRRDEERTSPTNLPTVLRPLIGRDAQLDALTELMGGVRLATLIGPGGAGKTSLALAAVARCSAAYDDGAFGVRLAAVSSSDQVPLAVADAIGVPLDGAAVHRDMQARLISFLARRRMLLLLDNCEHVIDAAASLIDDILAHCPDVTIMATSREALAIPDEVQVTVGPLDVPADSVAAREVLQYSGPQLFVERARAVRPGMVLGEDELLAIGRICRALDGIPLALELAAARVSSMSTGEIADRLRHRFSLLSSGVRTAEARQQTLRATVDWSYHLLSEVEQRVFQRLSVFQGGWTLTGAEAVIADESMRPGEVLNTIGRLAERSMLVVEPGATTRYRMLETLREYAAERLDESGQTAEVACRHAEHFSQVAQEAEVSLRGHHQRQTLRILRAEQPNIRAALSWLGQPGGDMDSALVMAGSLGMFWHLGRHLEGRELLARLMASGNGTPSARARALQAVSLVERPRACLVHPSPRCAETAAASLEIFEEIGDAWHAALSRVLLAVEGVTGVDRKRSESLLTTAEEHFLREGDAWGLAVIGFVRMETALKAGDVEPAVSIGRSTAAAFRQLDDSWGLSATLYHLGWGLRQFGRLEEGARALEEAIDVGAADGLWNTVQWALADLAVAKVHHGEPEAARRLFDEASAASQEVGDGAGEVLAGYGYGLLAQVHEDWPAARQHYAEAVDGFVALGTPVLHGVALAGLARCDEAEGDLGAAYQRYNEALTIGRRIAEPSVIAVSLEGLGRVALGRGQGDEAARLLAQAMEVRDISHRPAPPHERRDIEGTPRRQTA